MNAPAPNRCTDPLRQQRTARELLQEARWRVAAVLWRHAPEHGAPTPIIEALIIGRDIDAVLADFDVRPTPALVNGLRRELTPEWVV
jgi:hypothetical protein